MSHSDFMQGRGARCLKNVPEFGAECSIANAKLNNRGVSRVRL